MSTDVALRKHGVGRPRRDGSTMGLMERIQKWRIAERCSEFTDEYVDLLARVLRGQPVNLFQIVENKWP
jgi:hypothetical protein